MQKKRQSICSIPSCPNISYVRGLCSKHYQRQRNYGDPTFKPSKKKICIVENCGEFRMGRGFCKTHYRRYMKSGDPLKYTFTNKHKNIKFATEGGCNGRIKTTEICPVHNIQHHKRGGGKPCKLSYCDKKIDARGYCSYHYHLIRLTGINKEFEEIFGVPPYRCYICGKSYPAWMAGELELDHVTSKSNGGNEQITNLLPACRMCNRMKDKFILSDFLQKCKEIVDFNS